MCKIFCQNRLTLARHAKKKFLEKTKELEAGYNFHIVLLPFTLERASCKDPIVWESSNWNFRLWPLEMKEFVSIHATLKWVLQKLLLWQTCDLYEEAKI